VYIPALNTGQQRILLQSHKKFTLKSSSSSKK